MYEWFGPGNTGWGWGGMFIIGAVCITGLCVWGWGDVAICCMNCCCCCCCCCCCFCFGTKSSAKGLRADFCINLGGSDDESRALSCDSLSVTELVFSSDLSCTPLSSDLSDDNISLSSLLLLSLLSTELPLSFSFGSLLSSNLNLELNSFNSFISLSRPFRDILPSLKDGL